MADEMRDVVEARELSVAAEDLCEIAVDVRVDLVDTLAGIVKALRLARIDSGARLAVLRLSTVGFALVEIDVLLEIIPSRLQNNLRKMELQALSTWSKQQVF
jgi:hypothetical protein